MFTPPLVVPHVPPVTGFQVHEGNVSLEGPKGLLISVQRSSTSLFFSKVSNEVEISSLYPSGSLRLSVDPFQEVEEGLFFREVARAIGVYQSSLHPCNKMAEIHYKRKLIGSPVRELHHLRIPEDCYTSRLSRRI